MTSQVESRAEIMDIISKSDFLPQSKSDFHPISIAKNAPGAADIVAMAGAFSACKLGDDWKQEVAGYLAQKY